MGRFDWVIVRCPACGKQCDLQSKGGDCFLQVYDFETAPPEVLADMNNQAGQCDKCGAKFSIEVQVTAKAVLAEGGGNG